MFDYATIAMSSSPNSTPAAPLTLVFSLRTDFRMCSPLGE
jgi:hypothetical protein